MEFKLPRTKIDALTMHVHDFQHTPYMVHKQRLAEFGS